MSNLVFEVRGRVGILQIHRPEHFNALNRETLEELYDFFDTPPDLRALILTGSGDKAFAAGADIQEMQSLSNEEMLSFLHLGKEVANALEEAPFVTLAALNGYALGGGFELALACDFIYAVRGARVGLPEVAIGMIPGFGGAQRLVDAVGKRTAKELIFSGRAISAEEAFNLTLISRICEPGTLLETCYTTISTMMRNSFTAMMHAKELISEGTSLEPHETMELEQNLAMMCFASHDREEGMAAFLDKREPQFQP